MQIHCCYRLIPYGEVIHSTYDTDSGEIIGMPADWFRAEMLDLPEYSNRSYVGSKSNYEAMCESMLLSNNNFALVVENNNIGYYILDWYGVKFFMTAPTDNRDSSSGCGMPNQDNYKSIGYRTTQLKQLRACKGIYRLVQNRSDNLVHTNRGILVPQFNTNELTQPDFHYAGYKDAVAGGHDGVVYLNGVPTFVDIVDDDKLVPIL